MAPSTGNFEYAFSLFGLVLGFSLVEVLGGFARVIRTYEWSKVRSLAPMLGFIVMLDLISFWAILWQARSVIPVATLSLFAGFLISAIYYLAASSIFPKDGTIEDFDDHYLRIRRRVIAAILICNLLTYGVLTYLFGRLPQRDTMAVVLLFVALFVIALLIPKTWSRAHRLVLAVIITCYFAEAAWFYGA